MAFWSKSAPECSRTFRIVRSFGITQNVDGGWGELPMYNTSGVANLQVRAFSAQTALIRVNQEVGFLAKYLAGSLTRQSVEDLIPIKIASFGMRSAYFGGQPI